MMKALTTFAALLALALGMAACGKKGTENMQNAATSAGQAAGNAAGDAASSAANSLTASKDAAVQSAQDALDALEKKWQDFRTKAAPATAEARADFQKANDQMAQAIESAKAKLREAKDATANAWQNKVKPAFDSALQKAQKVYDDASAQFSGN